LSRKHIKIYNGKIKAPLVVPDKTFLHFLKLQIKNSILQVAFYKITDSI
jgi:hypothetical protein